MGCYQWVDSGTCNKPVFKGGLCEVHYNDASQEAASTSAATAVVMKWGPSEIKKYFGQVNNSFNYKKEYVGGSVAQPHVHNYSNGGAHVKVGNNEYVFLAKNDGRFLEDGWKQGVEAAGAKQKHLLLAMALVLAKSKTSGLSDIEVDKYIKNLPVS